VQESVTNVQDDDESHPLPHLTKIDFAVYLENGGYYGIVVEQPLANDWVTQERLRRKLDNYLNDFYSDGFKQDHGEPLPGKLRIYVKLHPASDRGIVDYLEARRPWLADNKVELYVGNLPSTIN
jgi:hypothetical protein